MTAITVTEFSKMDLPTIGVSGTAKKRGMVIVRATTASANETLDLSSVDANIADIEGIVFETDDGAVAATAGTWSTVTYTNSVAGVMEIGFMVTYN